MSYKFFNFLMVFALVAVLFEVRPATPVYAATGIQAPSANILSSWSKSAGGTSLDAGRGVTLDTNGNVVTTGTFYGTVDFDPGPGIINLTTDSTGVFILKMASNGNLVWAKGITIGPVMGGGFGNIITTDLNGNVYTTGTFSGTADFDPGAGVSNLTGGGGFVLKLDSNGDFVWAKNIGGNGNSVAVDSTSNVYTTGGFNGTVDFDPGPGTTNLTGSGDIFISKLDENGNFVWAKSVGGASNDGGTSIAVDSNNNILSTGYYQGTVDFDPGPGTANLSGGDIFVLKMDNNGNFVWAKDVGPAGMATANGISIDINNNVITTGSFTGTVDFDPGAGVFNLTSYGVYISKLDSNGNFIWARSIGGYSYSIATDTNNNVYTTGSFYNTQDFDPGVNVFNLISAGDQDIFISKLDSNGSFVWAKGLGGIGNDMGLSLALDSNSNVYTTGPFSNTADFDPGTGVSNLVSNGSWDVFISKLEEDNILPNVLSIVRTNASPTSGTSVDFTATFSESVTGVDSSDFGLTTTGVSGATVSGVSGSDSTYTVTVNTGSGNGTIRLNVLDDDTILDAALNPLGAGYTNGEIYSIIKSASFADVPLDYWASSYIERLYNAGITGGCGNGNYCPTNPVTRAQMAIFLEKGIHGSSFSPVDVIPTFTDTVGHFAEDWIEALKNDGVTSGCGAGIYCPESPVTRAQMAIFLLKAKYGAGYTPPAVGASTGFTDVPVGAFADAWIKQLVAEGITAGCGGGNYCPDASVTRDQMAVFLVKAFNLP